MNDDYDPDWEEEARKAESVGVVMIAAGTGLVCSFRHELRLVLGVAKAGVAFLSCE